MAQVAEQLADMVVVTSDNPRTEDPDAIIEDILTGFTNLNNSSITVEADRAAAIEIAVNLAQPGDIVLLAGKGHEDYQIIGTEKRHFSDFEETLKAAQSRS
jgi:UDP-N-acetylmuramoyl-L-alanyl-D-glutamate--2,6-diaminopimelate ligase